MAGPGWAIDAVWDIEAASWDQFLCGALWTPRDGVQVFREADELADALMSLPPGSQAWSHSGGKYDVLWLLDHLTRSGRKPQAQVSMSGSSATSVRFKKGPWLRDSARLIPMSLARAAKIAGPDRSKGDPGIPYEDFRKDMPEAIWRKILEYLVGDVELLRDVLMAVARYAASHGIELRGTIGGTAWATAVKWCGVDEYDWQASTYDFVRSAYYGGHCEVGMTIADRIWRYDRKSAYPASLKLPVPIGEADVCNGDYAARMFASGESGAYHVRIKVPRCHSPPLPLRHRDRLVYPYGSIEGVWPMLEIQHAMRQGCKVEKVRSAVVWHEESDVLAPYSDRCFELRDYLAEGDKKSLGVWLKFLANSLTGKLGQSPDFRIVVIGDYADDPRYEQVGSSPWVWSRESWRIPQCAMVHWAMTLTARARVELHEQILHVGDHWVYSDTDSCFSTIEQTRNIGDQLGDFAFEGEGRKWTCKAPKVYAYEDVGKGSWVAHAKGVPMGSDGENVDMDTFQRYARGEPITTRRGVKSLMQAARGERLFQRRELTRKLKFRAQWVGARRRLSDGKTRAPHVTELASL